MMNTINTKMTKSDCLEILSSKENIWFYYSQALYT
ncbi:biotin synthase BioB, partial [Enterococcus faecalis]|nr:biotin synthase BioB [Enterococcus faecalis]